MFFPMFMHFTRTVLYVCMYEYTEGFKYGDNKGHYIFVLWKKSEK